MNECTEVTAYTPPPPITYQLTYNKTNKHLTSIDGLSLVADASDKGEVTHAHLKKEATTLDLLKEARWDTVPCQN